MPERLAPFATEGKLTTSATNEELAEKIGIRGDTLATTVETYNRDCDTRVDSLFFKPSPI